MPAERQTTRAHRRFKRVVQGVHGGGRHAVPDRRDERKRSGVVPSRLLRVRHPRHAPLRPPDVADDDVRKRRFRAQTALNPFVVRVGNFPHAHGAAARRGGDLITVG